jgi:hypothetical protein
MTRYFIVVFAFLIVILSSSCGESAGMKYNATGTYIDSAGTQHPWKIDENHNLAWDGQPYIPFGCVFVPKSLAPGATPEAYDLDVKTLQDLLAKNISDIILKSPVPITSVDIDVLQKMLDYIESCGLAYGLDMTDGPKQPLKGYQVQPSVYRKEGPFEETTIVRDWPGVDSALYIVLNRQDLNIEEQGGALVTNGKVTVQLVNPVGPGRILMVYPRTVFQTIEKGGYGDPWAGYAEYRDRLITYFKKVKLGKGLRFIINPLNIRIDYSGKMANFVPDSGGFRIGFESYLIKRHINEHTLNSVWTIGRGGSKADQKVTLENFGVRPGLDTIETGARLLPMWGAGRGAPYVYDKASGKFFSADTATSQVWKDITDYRETSTQEFLNTISDILKTNIACVPVILSSSSFHTSYMNPFAMTGFDGLASKTQGTGESGAVAAGPVYALCEESPRTQWFVAVTAPQPNGAFADETALTASLDSYRSLGAKGFFLDSVSSSDASANDASVAQIQWLSSFRQKIKIDELASYKPEVVSYPVNPAVGGFVSRLAPGVWWLPSSRPGKTNYIGDGLAAYTFLAENRSYIWSLDGTKTVTTRLGTSENPGIVYPRGTSISKKKVAYSFKVSDIPVVISGSNFATLFPYETATGEIERLVKLIESANNQKIDSRAASEAVKTANNVLKNNQPAVAFGMAHTALLTLANTIGSDIWMEGERSDATSFTGTQSMKGASGGIALCLDEEQDPPLSPFAASFSFNSKADSSYELWAAGTPPQDGSPMVYSVDGGVKTPVTAAEGTLAPYAPGLAWYKIGVINTFAGDHNISFQATDKRASDQRYSFAIDVLVLSPKGFTPSGLKRP